MRLNNQQIKDIKKLYSSGCGLSELGRKFGVDHSTIYYHTHPGCKEKNRIRSRNYKRNKSLKRVKSKVKRIKRAVSVREYKSRSMYKEYFKKQNVLKDLPISVLFKDKILKR